jgi:hypothetical protein
VSVQTQCQEFECFGWFLLTFESVFSIARPLVIQILVAGAVAGGIFIASIFFV